MLLLVYVYFPLGLIKHASIDLSGVPQELKTGGLHGRLKEGPSWRHTKCAHAPPRLDALTQTPLLSRGVCVVCTRRNWKWRWRMTRRPSRGPAARAVVPPSCERSRPAWRIYPRCWGPAPGLRGKRRRPLRITAGLSVRSVRRSAYLNNAH